MRHGALACRSGAAAAVALFFFPPFLKKKKKKKSKSAFIDGDWVATNLQWHGG